MIEVSTTSLPLTSSPVPRRILYADDVPELRELMSMALGRDGYFVECVADGVLALEKLREEVVPFDLLITDHHMPNMNGVELVQQLKELGYPGKILIFSSDLSHEISGAYRELKVERFLLKPVFPSILRQVLKEIFAAPVPRAVLSDWRDSLAVPAQSGRST
jgi:two-component system, chemotaxis family, chemotaxis protein CheY